MKKDKDELDYYEIGQRIRKYRKACGMSQEELAEKVDISTTHLSHIETGNTKLSLVVLVKIASALSLITDDILNEETPISHSATINKVSSLLDTCTIKEQKIVYETISSLLHSIRKYEY